VRIQRIGPDALLVEVADTAAAIALFGEARRRQVAATDVVPGARTVLFDGAEDPDALAAELEHWTPAAGSATAGKLVEVPTRYDGADLEDVARRWAMTTREVVATHTGTPFTVAFCGFAPGFAYCSGLPESLAVPRLDTPRPRVPAGAVGLAGAFTGVYPTASPGGWRLVGRTDLRLWDPDRAEPAALPPGTRVRFVEA
jgi:KipI family sensor histidine kinase inhibitor